MWRLTNETDFRAERCFARARDGAEWWLVGIKATFCFVDGELRRAEEQEPIQLGPVFTGDPGRSSLRYEADVALGKLATDVVLHGTAYAPGGRPTHAVDVTLSVGPIRKTLRVVGDRSHKRGLRPAAASAAVPFVTMPLSWERAFGGVDPEDGLAHAFNPVGTGFSRNSRAASLVPPNVEYPGESYDPSGRDYRPAGFGPIARHWSPRRELAGTYDEAWRKSRCPLHPVDYSERFVQCAPDDQQVAGTLAGGEDVRLTNLTPSGTWGFKLPRLPLACTTSFSTRFSKRPTHQHPRLRTVVLEPDRDRVLMTWIVEVRCENRLYQLDGSRLFLKRYTQRSAGLRP